MKGCSSKYRQELRLISSFEQGKQLPSVVTVKKDFYAWKIDEFILQYAAWCSEKRC